ncbi:flagellar hook protein FlgE [Actinoplanes sp. NBRC 14428]|uniref:Flagellar hook protein FlgE n=1 Tax=Pseudosporangium ferrugineum TaxID=439699 RepID=A0A2T0S5P2_9ACTN|nr:flagellar hook protein FlgE [Pseudosporangium ferrugineum]PRY28726.1 flagellar hook protein FlgE [Pseudosporangium ferrugineum]BCJ53813.1 flagellar hook protein FlgE [Actinoplanes sp. NBRC 14428]
MLRSLFSGISGLRAHQQMMDVTGNNISNVNTTGYKSSQTVFQDTLSQMVNAAGAPQNGSGGTNPAQVGLGVRTASVNANFSQGAAQTTGKAGDMMIQGDGFFITKSGGETVYTRAGSFTFDANGSLTTPNGQIVQGWSADTNGVVNTAGAPGDIKLPIGISLAPEQTTAFTLTGNLSYEAPVGATSAKTIPIPTIDANGQSGTLEVVLTKAAPIAGVEQWTITMPNVLPAVPAQTIPFPGGRAQGTLVAGVDTGKITMNGYEIDIHDLTTYAGNTEARVSASDGSAAGILNSYTVSNTGQIVGVFSNGLKQTLGQLALANFNNVNGLEKIGDSMFRSTVNSGLAQVGSAGSAGLGLITSGALEMSNVDLAQEFTNLVIAQRGFQANSRIITTSDEILQELVNLKR